MGRAPTLSPDERATAYDRLAHALDEADTPVPCRGPDADLWVSDRRKDQQTAAAACTACPAYEACLTYITTVREPAGVWAGMTREYRGEPL